MSRTATAKSPERPVADNRKAGYDYHLLEQFEAGVSLRGTEVKAIREGRVNLRDAYCRFTGDELFLVGAHISQYSHDGHAGHDATRPRKLLLNRIELNKLLGRTVEKGQTIVPLKVYFKNGRIKVAIALARGKKHYDKRETIRRREVDRETRAAVKNRQE